MVHCILGTIALAQRKAQEATGDISPVFNIFPSIHLPRVKGKGLLFVQVFFSTCPALELQARGLCAELFTWMLEITLRFSPRGASTPLAELPPAHFGSDTGSHTT